jgi:shikimate 5-dehydrogenase
VLLRVHDVAISRAYKILRTRVLHRLAANNWTTLGITGTAAGEGKSLTAVNLALALAQDVNTWVTLVDLVYAGGESRLVGEARKRGAAVVDGLEVLVQQGGESLRLWTGMDPPLDVMRKAAKTP